MMDTFGLGSKELKKGKWCDVCQEVRSPSPKHIVQHIFLVKPIENALHVCTNTIVVFFVRNLFTELRLGFLKSLTNSSAGGFLKVS